MTHDTLTATDALAYARKAGYGAARRYGIGATDAADDIASAALTVLVESDKPFTSSSIAAAAGIIASNMARGRDGYTYAQGGREKGDYALTLSADRPMTDDGGTLMDTASDTLASNGPVQTDRTIETILPNGLRVRVSIDGHGPIIETAVLTDSNGYGVLASGADALRQAYALSVAAVSTASAGQAKQKAVGALSRDAAVLAFVGSAADAVAAGLAPTAGAFRAAVCAARKRQSGGTAHSAA